MTVVSYLKLSPKVGMSCADERETRYGVRSYDVTRKIHQVGKCVIGFAGVVANGLEILRGLRLTADANYSEVERELKRSYDDVREKSFYDEVLKQYSVTQEMFIRQQINPEIEKLIRKQLEDYPPRFGVTFLLGGLDEHDDFMISRIFYPGVLSIVPNYTTIGSGSDRADAVIGDFLHDIQREGRVKISKHSGAYTLMKATQAAWRNEGVGGHTQLVWVDGDTDDHCSELGTQESTLLNNVLYCERKGIISREKATEAFKAVIEDNAKADELVKELAGKIGNDKMAELFFLQSLHL